ncbi:PqqD family protein [Eubacterium sp. AF34-35BH]|nr:PqqD family protein [Eubacterium sp.]RGF52573.1 PqqD family protein [Eubacterium sp. AF36-5BH]RHP22371.1 PqqD family protein [Eubacterium sp. AF34-35BH]
MKIKQGFILRNVAGNNVVVPVGEATIDFNGMMSLNETGAFLFEKMIEGTTKEQLIEQLMSQYEIDADTAKNDVEEFIEKVKKENLFE